MKHNIKQTRKQVMRRYVGYISRQEEAFSSGDAEEAVLPAVLRDLRERGITLTPGDFIRVMIQDAVAARNRMGNHCWRTASLEGGRLQLTVATDVTLTIGDGRQIPVALATHEDIRANRTLLQENHQKQTEAVERKLAEFSQPLERLLRNGGTVGDLISGELKAPKGWVVRGSTIGGMESEETEETP